MAAIESESDPLYGVGLADCVNVGLPHVRAAPSFKRGTPANRGSLDCYFPLAFAALTLAHRAFVAAMMLARPSALIFRLGLAGAVALAA